MKNLIKLAAQDVRYGLIGMWPGFLGAFLLISFFFLVLHLRVQASFEGLVSLSFLDFVVCFTAGIPTYVFDPTDPFKIPAQWLMVYLLIAYSTLHYPSRDLSGIGMHIIVASGDRKHWWLAKCLWIALCVLAFFLIGITTAALWASITGGELGSSISNQALTALGFKKPYFTPQPLGIAGIVIVAMVATMSICYAQMLISILTRPLFGFIATISILFLSAFIQTPFLIGNYLMAARSSLFVMDGLDEWSGIVCSIAISVISIILGKTYFQNTDILGAGDQS